MKSIGVIISTYNGEKYIGEQLLSILNQTKRVDAIYIFDDCSKDNTIKEITKVLNEYPNADCHLIINIENKGWKKNFIEGLQQVKEDLIFIADQDDIWMPNKVEIMSDCFEKNENINVLVSNYDFKFMENHTNEKKAELRKLNNDNSLEKIEMNAKNFYTRNPGCTFCIRQSYFIDKYKYWNENLAHDAFIWKIGLFSNSLFRINVPLIEWRRHDSNETNSKEQSKKYRIIEIESYLSFMNSIQNVYKNKYINKGLKFFTFRKRIFSTKNIFIWIHLFFFYRNFYVSTKSCIGDLYFLFFNKF